MSYQAAIRQLSEARLTAQMTANAVRLLARMDADGAATLEIADLQSLFEVASRSSARKYLARLRAAGLVDYSLGRRTVQVWWLAFAAAEVRPAAARRGPLAGRERSRGGAAAMTGQGAEWSPWERQ